MHGCAATVTYAMCGVPVLLLLQVAITFVLDGVSYTLVSLVITLMVSS